MSAARVDGRAAREAIDRLVLAGVVAPAFYTRGGEPGGRRWIVPARAGERVYSTREAVAFAHGAASVLDALRDTYAAALALADGEAVTACGMLLDRLAPMMPGVAPLDHDAAQAVLDALPGAGIADGDPS